MRRALCGNDTSALSRYFPTLLRSVMTACRKNPKQDILSLTKINLITYNKGKSLAMPTDDQLRTQLREINAYSLMCIRPVLERIEHFGATAAVDTSALNIEHIMPQNPNKWWKQNSGTKDEDEYTFYANLIGNLTLCAEYDNSHMGNEDFAFKKSILSKTLHIRMNTDILKQKKWNKDQILKRCDALAAQIIRIYPYNGANAVRKEPQPAVIVDEEIYSLSAPTVSARAIRHSDSDVEVLAGSVMKEYGAREMKTMRSLYLDLDDRGIFHTIDGGRIQFTQSWHFKDLNTAAQFLMHRGGDNREAWKKETASVKETAEQPAEPKKKSRNTGKVRREVRKIKGKKKKTAAA